MSLLGTFSSVRLARLESLGTRAPRSAAEAKWIREQLADPFPGASRAEPSQ